MIRFLLTGLLALFVPAVARGQQVDAETGDFPPGLLATYEAAGAQVKRIDPDLSFDWKDASPDERLSDGPFRAGWQGQLLVREAATYRFHLWLAGSATVRIGERVVLKALRETPGWASAEQIELPFGEHPLSVSYEQTSDVAEIHLFWSSSHFPLEPVPYQLLFRETGRPGLAQAERGRVQYEVFRCGRCHDTEAPLAAPALESLAVGTDPGWLIEKLQQPADDPTAKMPAFGFSPGEARAIAAFLLDRSREVKLDPPGRVKEKDFDKELRSGRMMLASLGCLACHQRDGLGVENPYGGGDLTRIAEKRSADWLHTWLADPERLNRDHRMPVFRLSKKERTQLVLALTQTSRVQPERASIDLRPDALIEQGRKLVEQARCANCHRIPGIEADRSGIPALKAAALDGVSSCVQPGQDPSHRRPAYARADRDALRACLSTPPRSAVGAFNQGRRLLTRQGCIACHERDGRKGLAGIAKQVAATEKGLTGQSQALIPPALTAIGDKLHDRALVEAVAGNAKTVRLPWLRVRMPRFKHSDAEQQALVAYLTGHDRIPDGAPGLDRYGPPGDPGDSQRMVVAHELSGGKGFNCVACHALGDYEPKNVALGTRGSDLHLLGKRMRRSFFFRWTRSPLRVVPGVEMPSYERPLPGVLGGDVDRQLAAIWDALNDPRFKAPTNPASVEQYLTVGPGEPARIVRDVFALPKDHGGGAVARALAIGFNNGHSLLYDLDRFQVRQWTLGDFARQRTVGKSWYWDLAGVELLTGFGQAADLALQPKRRREAAPIQPILDRALRSGLVAYSRRGEGVAFEYQLPLELDGEFITLPVNEFVGPVDQGWRRTIEIDAGELPGYDVLISRPVEFDSVGQARIHTSEEAWLTFDNERREYRRLPETNGVRRLTVEYSADVSREWIAPKPPVPDELVPEPITSLPGFTGARLPVARSIMPTALAWTDDGTLAFTSLKGNVFFARDTDGDGLEDSLELFEEGLSAPFGILAEGDDLLVVHKPEVLRLRDTDGDGRADRREVVAAGWGYTDNYHDWATGLVRDNEGRMYLGLGSDYAQPGRPEGVSRWRGDVLRIETGGRVAPVGHGFRYPIGLALGPDGAIYVSDQQGVQNTFNEINRLIPGAHYGVPKLHEPDRDAEVTPAAVEIPHPWTRSVNGIFFVPNSGRAGPLGQLAGQGIGCEYDTRFLMRFTLEEVDGVVQGAAYPLSRPSGPADRANFTGPICGAISPEGEIYIGNIHDSGWQGGQNTGDLVRLSPTGDLPNGIRRLSAAPDGFEIEFFGAVDPAAAEDPEQYSISGYTRIWGGGYATPDSGRHRAEVTSATLSDDNTTVLLTVEGLRQGHVYDVACGEIAAAPLWPAVAHYTLTKRPRATGAAGAKTESREQRSRSSAGR